MKPVSVFLLAFLAMGIGVAAESDKEMPDLDEDLDVFDENENILENVPAAEMKKEAERLEAEEERVKKNNKAFAKGKAATSEGLNQFSAMAQTEFEEDHEGLEDVTDSEGEFRMMGLEMDPESVQNDPEARAIAEEFYKKFDEERAYIPKNWNSCTDYDKGWCTPVRNQGNCGSCAAFAAMGMIEIAMAKAGAEVKGLDLSEQYLVDCAYTGRKGEASGCHGAGIIYYPKWFATTAGGTSPHQGVYPYLDNQPFLHCKAYGSNKYWNAPKWNSGAKVVKHIYDYRCDQTNGRYDDSKLKKLIMAHGAVMTGIRAGDRAFKSAKKIKGWKTGGVFDECTSNKLDHGVVVVGWGEEWGYSSRYKRKMNKKYWLIKNSWGTGWGDEGYLKVERGQCGLGSVCVTVEAKRVSGRDPAPNVAPTDNTSPEMDCDMTKVFKEVFPDKRYKTGDWTLRYWTGTKTMVSKVTCRQAVCEPAQAGRTHGCMYICGQKQCNHAYKGFHNNGRKPNPGYDPVNPRPRPRPDNGSSKKWCDLRRMARRTGGWRKVYNGSVNLRVTTNGRRSTKYLECKKNKCKARYSSFAPKGACMYICGKASCQ